MIGTFVYLIGRSAANRVVRQLRRLREPRYLIAVLLGAAYLWFLVAQQRPDAPASRVLEARWIEPAGALAVALAVAWAWIFAVERRALAFTAAEVTFLFPAPLSRRQLIHFKLLRSQLVILFNVLLWTLVLSHERFDSSAWLRAAGIWVLLTTLSLHRLGASFVRGSLSAHGVHGARRRLGSLTVLGVVLLGVALVALDARAPLVGGWNEGIGPFLAAVGSVLEGPAARLLLAPFRVAIGALLARDLPAWVEAMLPALVLLALHYLWVVRSDAAFQESAAEASLQRARTLADRSRGRGSPRSVRRKPPPYPLAPLGAPAGAIVWKNLVAVARTGRPRGIGLTLGAGGVLAAILSFRPNPTLAEIVGWLALMGAGFLLLVGPQWIRSDLRGDLPKLDLLRSYPLPGRTLVGAEVAASTLVLTMLHLGVLLLAYLAFLGNRMMELDLAARTAALAAAIVVLPAVNLLGLLIHNGAAILFPAWIGPASDRPGGVEALGQNMLAIIGYVGLLMLALVLPLTIGAGLWVALEPAIGWWAAGAAVAGGLVAAATEARVMVGWIGRAFEQTDPATAGISG